VNSIGGALSNLWSEITGSALKALLFVGLIAAAVGLLVTAFKRSGSGQSTIRIIQQGAEPA
jgi:hypothetical protein